VASSQDRRETAAPRSSTSATTPAVASAHAATHGPPLTVPVSSAIAAHASAAASAKRATRPEPRTPPQALPPLNRAPGGPLAIVNFTSTYIGLTSGPGSLPREPDRFNPTGRRNFVRVIPADDLQSAAAAIVARRLRIRRVFTVTDGQPYRNGLVRAIKRAATLLGIEIVGGATTTDNGPYGGIARRIARSHADGVFIGQASNTAGMPRTLSRAFAPRIRVLEPDSIYIPPGLGGHGGASGEGITITTLGPPLTSLPPAGLRFAQRLARVLGQEPDPYAIYAGQATEVLLDAIARSNGSRRSVTRELFRTRVHGGLLNDFAITPTGDTTAGAVTANRVHEGTPRLVDVITPPARLIAGSG